MLEISILEQKLLSAKNETEYLIKRRQEDDERFKLLSMQAISNQTDRLNVDNSRKLNEILLPFKQELEKFGKTVSECYDIEAKERFSLKEKIKDLATINDSLGKEARELTLALKGNNRIQGQWGELVLETILQKSGLRENEEYFIQESYKSSEETDNMRVRPDVVVKFSASKKLIIDSKTSLNAFIEYMNSQESEDREKWGMRHVDSIKRHIDDLAKKSYEKITRANGIDFILMFIPNDAAYITAMQLDSVLWQRAYDKNIIIVSPTLLFGALKIIARQWDFEKQNRNAIEIANTAGKIYDKFALFVQDLERIGNGLITLQKIYSDSMKKLKDGNGSIMSNARKLKEMGVESSKNITE